MQMKGESPEEGVPPWVGGHGTPDCGIGFTSTSTRKKEVPMRRLSSLTVVFALLALASTASAEGLKHQLGTWKLNVAKSKTEASTAKSQTRVYEDWGGGLLHMRYEGTDAQGNPTLGEFVARFDGKAYPYVFRGAPGASTISLKWVGDRTFAFAMLTDGKTSYTGTHTVAADGKSFTFTYKTNGKGEPSSTVLVFDKQ
jgi:hypothetical protein